MDSTRSHRSFCPVAGFLKRSHPRSDRSARPGWCNSTPPARTVQAEWSFPSLPEVMAALGTRARRTAFRKLKELTYRTSYSHRGGYYTLEELIDFDQHGLWSFRAVRFSAAGTLLATAVALVGDAPAGQFSEELDNLLHVGTQDALRKLVPR